MKKLCMILSLLMLGCSLAWGQKAEQFSMRVMAGQASYGMSDLRTFYDAAHRQLAFSPKVTADFPAFYYYEAQVFYSPVADWKFGLSYGTTSTGARKTYSDYSGAYYFDQRIRSREYGVVAMYTAQKWSVGKWNAFSLNPGLALSAVYTAYEVEERVKVYDHKEYYHHSFSAVGAGIRPFINLSWQYRFIELMADAGYLLNPGKGLEAEGNSGQLLDPSGDKVKPDWSGYRLGLGAGINLNGFKKKQSL